jgi:hypothetical protein
MLTNKQKMSDYSKSKIYVIKNTENDKVFLGATKSSLNSCMSIIRYTFKKSPDLTKKLHVAFQEIGIEKFRIEKVEDYPCSTSKEMNLRLKELIKVEEAIEKGYNDTLPAKTRSEKYHLRCKNDPEFVARESIRKRESFVAKYSDPEFRRQKLDYHKNLFQTSEKYREASRQRKRRYRLRQKEAVEKLQNENAEGTR